MARSVWHTIHQEAVNAQRCLPWIYPHSIMLVQLLAVRPCDPLLLLVGSDEVLL